MSDRREAVMWSHTLHSQPCCCADGGGIDPGASATEDFSPPAESPGAEVLAASPDTSLGGFVAAPLEASPATGEMWFWVVDFQLGFCLSSDQSDQ